MAKRESDKGYFGEIWDHGNKKGKNQQFPFFIVPLYQEEEIQSFDQYDYKIREIR